LRLHARVEINRNKFMLIDQSTNGTFVLGQDGEEHSMRAIHADRREGLIGLGKAPDRQFLAGDPLRLRGVNPRQRTLEFRLDGRREPRSPNSPKYFIDTGEFSCHSLGSTGQEFIEGGRRHVENLEDPIRLSFGQLADCRIARTWRCSCIDR